MSNPMMNKINRELIKLEKEIELANSYIPEGYKIAKDSLSERVKLMADGLRAYSEERAELLQEISYLDKRLNAFTDA